MKALLVDIYRTVLEVGPPAPGSMEAWDSACENLGIAPLSHAAFWAACMDRVAADHAAAGALGVVQPEVDWREIVASADPRLRELPRGVLDPLIRAQVNAARSLRLMPGAAETLAAARNAGMPVGIVSNAQAYTLGELDAALADTGFDRAAFAPDLVFWSFLEGYAKPDPHVFRRMRFRCTARGLDPGEVLMVGDRMDNDILPARREGFAALHLTGADRWAVARAMLGL